MVELRKTAPNDETFDSIVQETQVSFDLKVWSSLLGVLRVLKRSRNSHDSEFVYVKDGNEVY